MTRWFKSDLFGDLADVRYAPESDRVIDLPGAR